MEGPLSKWTNVMQGWQYRWFVLDENGAALSYYVSKEKMNRGHKRGYVRLKGAVVGIDDEDESTFTITVDQKMFHFQARDMEERDRWIRALEATIQRFAGYHTRRLKNGNHHLVDTSAVNSATTMREFERKITEADQYLQLMIEQVNDLESRVSKAENERERETLTQIVESANAMLESVKHSIVVLQLAKNTVSPLNFASRQTSIHDDKTGAKESREKRSKSATSDTSIPEESGDSAEVGGGESMGLGGGIEVGDDEHERDPGSMVPVMSYSSDEDEEYFDVEEEVELAAAGISIGSIGVEEGLAGSQSDIAGVGDDPDGEFSPPFSNAPELVFSGDASVDFDSLYDNDEEDELGDVQEHGSVIMHLVSQVSIGMDLTKITLPTFILERRSLLEMYADFFAYTDLFIQTVDMSSPEQRMIGVLKWYLSSFYAGRRSGVAKKPYNPLLGETFRCAFDVPGYPATGEKVTGGPLSNADRNQLTFIAEQVSHHPPISAFYAEFPAKKVQVDAHIWTKSKFLGLSIGVHNIGQGCVSFLEHGEEYIVSFPHGYGRSILTTPWIELAGKVKITCEKSGYGADVEFLAKPFYGGKAHCVTAAVYQPNQKSPILTVKGQWNGNMMAKDGKKSSPEYEFLNVHKVQIHKKKVNPIADQDPFESRRIWKHVTRALRENEITRATKCKHWLEQRQRSEAKDRAASGDKWQTKVSHLSPAQGPYS